MHSPTDGYLGCCFHLLATVNNAAVNVGIQISFQDSAFNSFGYILRSGNAGSYGHSIFNFLRKYQTVFHSGCTIPTGNAQNFQVLHILANACSFSFSFFLNSSHPKEC